MDATPCLIRVIALAAMCLALSCHDPSPARQPPHIILITADTLRADHLGAYGYERPTSPNIDRLATQSTLFSNAVTVIPKTGPSFTTMFSGRYPAEHRVGSNTVGIPANLPLLAEKLAESGYRTAGFVSNPVVRSATGYGRGFVTYQFHGGPAAMHDVTRSFLSWADQAWEQPTFVWIHYIDPHGPYRPPPAYEQMFLADPLAQSDRRVALNPQPGSFSDANKVLGAIPKYQRHGNDTRVAAYIARYDAEIRAMDDEVGKILAFLRERELFERSLVVFTSDHGESLGEHNSYFEHGWFAYEPTLRVPLLIKPPGRHRGTTATEQVSNLDLMPTVLAAAAHGDTPDVPGRNILGVIPPHRAVLIENSDRYPDKYVGVRTSRWKYLRRLSDSREELYDLAADPGEMRNLARDDADVLTELRREHEKISASISARQPSKPGPDTEEIRRQLRSLGYLE
ncbi:MAG: sulfatase [Candidatus Binatia bacterium]